MSALSQDFIQKIAHSLEEEEIDVYTLALYSMSTDDLNYFNESDREKIKRIFKVLMEDTRHHSDLLKLILDIGGD